MGRGKLCTAAAWAAVLAGCGAGRNGDSTGGGSAQTLTGNLVLVDHAPAEGAIQVPLSAPIELRFDGVVVPESLQDPDTWLRDAGTGERLEGSFEVAAGGRTVRFHPNSGLQPQTDYEFQLSPLTCDNAGRILELTTRFSFRSLDATPPAVLGATIAPGESGVDRRAPVDIDLSEDLDPASLRPGSVYLRDVYGNDHPVDVSVSGPALRVAPVADLAGGRGYVLVVAGGGGGLTDRAGNPLPADWSLPFTAAPDHGHPSSVSVWPPPAGIVSPLASPTFTFDESMDPASVEPVSVLFLDEFGSLVPFRVHASRDRRSLRIEPQQRLVAGRSYTLALRAGLGAVTDVSGNSLAAPAFAFFDVGSDDLPPALASAEPAPGETRVSRNARLVLRFDEPLDPARVDQRTVHLDAGAGPVPIVVEMPDPQTVRVTPSRYLEPATDYRLRLLGGPDGLRDPAGNALVADVVLDFRTSDDPTPPVAFLQPRDGAAGVPLGARIAAVFDDPLDPTTVGAGTVTVEDSAGRPVFGSISLEQGGRVVSFAPAGGWQAGASYRVRLAGGPRGLREASGNWLAQDVEGRFRAGFQADTRPPEVEVRIDGTGAAGLGDIVLPPMGFAIEVDADDPEHSIDWGSVRLVLQGAGPTPDPAAWFAGAEVGPTGFRVVVESAQRLPAGEYTLLAEVADLSSNRGASPALRFRVVEPDPALLPFERTQVVWVRTDLDRDGNGIADFEDDLLRLGFATPGDPAGTNAWVAEVVRAGIFARTNQLLHRGPAGEYLGAESVPVRLTDHRPLGLAHMQMALGGLDPAGPRGRGYGDPSTAILGRALYDYRNQQVNERNISQSPALGVFPSEMFLFQVELHLQVYPAFQTLFAQRFLNICPQMGGIAAGSHPDDAVVLAPTFDYASATATQRARFHQVFDAADDWAAVIGVVLAHEIGHSVGLVAPGPLPAGLNGDASLHNEFSTAAEVMASAVGYESMVTLDYAFRDLNLAYLRQRVLLR